jgi:hypothetical protein
MKTITRIILTFLSFAASYFFIYWVPFSLIPGAHNIPAIPLIVSYAAAFGIGIFIWKKTGNISTGLFNYIILGGIIIGSIGFIIGFLGPIIFSSSSNQGPLLGIFITGPIGFLIGLVSGGIYWLVGVKNKK